MDEDSDILRRVIQQTTFGLRFSDLRDSLLFDFNDEEDVKLVLRELREDMNCAINVCIRGQEYLPNSVYWSLLK